MVGIALLIILAFIIGSIPVGVLVAKTKGIDLKMVGSGNIGATNVLRSLGKGPAALTLLGDVMKGVIVVALGKYFGMGTFYQGLIGLSAILGHNFSLFLRFRGGKGVATSLGVFILYSPQTALITSIIWAVVVLTTKYSSLGALISFGLLPLNVILFDSDSKDKLPIAFLVTIFILLRHSDNIRRLMKGTERRIGERV